MNTSGEQIPVLDLKPEMDEIWDEVNAAIQGVLRSGQFILGPYVEAFEQDVAAYLGTAYSVGVNSGTDALVIALRASGVGPGDEVITSPFTFFATAESIDNIGATSVFVDIDPTTFNIDPDAIAARIGPKTKAIVPVHLFGHAADMDPILALAAEHNLKVIEDVAQAFGAEYKGRKLGTIGDAGAYSFFPSKNLGGCGDGGLIATHNPAIANESRRLRAHGATQKYYNEVLGYNSRLDALQAAILSVKLKRIEAQNAGRRRVAAAYNERLAGIDAIVLPQALEYTTHVYHQYTIRILDGRRDAVQKALQAAGIQTMVYYPVPCHKLPIYAGRNETLPQAEKAAAEVLSLPIWPQMTEATIDRVVEALRAALA